MSFNLLEQVRGYFTPELVDSIAEYLGETKRNVEQGLSAIVPASLAGIAHKAEVGETSHLLSLAKEAVGSGILGNLADGFTTGGKGIPSVGPGLITGILGDRYGAIANGISSFAGLKGASVSSLFGSVMPLALAVLGRYASDHQATPGAVSTMLSGIKEQIGSALPAGFSLAPFFTTKTHHRPTHASSTAEERRSGNRWLLPLLAILAALALLWWMMKGCGSGNEVSPATTSPPDTVTKTDVLVVTKESLKVRLPNGEELDAFKGGIEDLLVQFLNDPKSRAGKDNWFDFSELNFKFGTAEITPESRKEVDNLVRILKAYPRLIIKIGGYTDKVGNEAANKKLSGERAAAILAALTEAGVGDQVEGAEGYGSDFAKFPADAPEEDRIKDRRVSVSVRAK